MVVVRTLIGTCAAIRRNGITQLIFVHQEWIRIISVCQHIQHSKLLLNVVALLLVFRTDLSRFLFILISCLNFWNCFKLTIDNLIAIFGQKAERWIGWLRKISNVINFLVITITILYREIRVLITFRILNISLEIKGFLVFASPGSNRRRIVFKVNNMTLFRFYFDLQTFIFGNFLDWLENSWIWVFGLIWLLIL